jgi:hypothetical protein
MFATEEAAGGITSGESAHWTKEVNESIAKGQRYRRHFVWGKQMSVISPTALWTETAEALPSPPLSEFLNVDAINTINSRPDLFRVDTPINVDVFQSMLEEAGHPNPSFYLSVCSGLRHGFWPWADTHYGKYPTTWEEPTPVPAASQERDFLRDQIAKEVRVGRYSSDFGPELLPGMYSMPIHAVPKEGGKYRLVTNHSAGSFSLNSMIAKADIAGVTLDNVQHLGNALRQFRQHEDNRPLIIWKADVSEAYRHMPMHPLWQIKQIVSFEGRRHVDRANVFGGRASQRIFHAFMSLVIWIATFVRLILAYIYVDDSFSYAEEHDLAFYAKYQKLLPRNMVKLLQLWDELGIPHEERKQIFGSPLPVIGFDVDPQLMRITLRNEAKSDLISELRTFARHRHRRTLRECEHIAGSLNWALNVAPMLRPGLAALYKKMKGKTQTKALVWLNRRIVLEILWAAEHLERSNGVYLLKSVSWNLHLIAHAPDVLRVYCDASGVGMGFWYPSLHLGFQSNLPARPPVSDIFFYEALCVASAIHDALSRILPGHRLAVFTDSLDTVSIFNSLSGETGYNQLLMFVVDLILATEVDFRVFHIAGERNVVADHLSRNKAREALTCVPHLRILPFEPPRNALGVGKK